jgi:hypothetical protein
MKRSMLFLLEYIILYLIDLLRGARVLPLLNLTVLKWYFNFGSNIYSLYTFYIENKTDGHALLYISGNSSLTHEFKIRRRCYHGTKNNAKVKKKEKPY